MREREWGEEISCAHKGGRRSPGLCRGEGEIQVKCSYVEGGGCRACCLADWRGRAPKVAYLIEVGASLKLLR
jgi:hypothetical protein